MSADAAVIDGARGVVVRVGSRVTLREHGRVHEVELTDRILPAHRVVDPDSALGVALMGRGVGDEVTVELGHGWPDRVASIEGVA